LILSVVISIVPYASAVGMGFIYDDHPQIEHNPYLRLWPGFVRVFTSDVWSLTGIDSDASYYRPLMWVVYNAIYTLVGATPWAFHLVNVLLHTGVTAVVFFLTLQLWKDLKIAGIAAVLFALHPVHTEPVVWIAAIPELGYTLFFLLALYLYVLDYKPELHGAIAFSLCYALALLWKETAVTFLPCVVLYDLLVRRQFRTARYATLAGVTVAYLTVRTLALGSLTPPVIHDGLSVPTQILTAISHLGIYLQKLLMPVKLTFFYSLQATRSIDLRIAVVLLLFAAAAWKIRGKLAWSVYWIPLTLLPALAVSRVVVPLAERNLYLASVGFVWIAAQILARLPNPAALALAGAVSVAYFAVDALRVPVWRDELPLFGQALQLDPDNNFIRLRLSTEYGHRGRYDEAMVQLDEILKRSPRDLKALTSKAGLYVFKEDWQAVESTCKRAFEVDPNSSVCHLDVGLAQLQQGQKEEAWRSFDSAYQSDPRMWQALLQQGTLALEAGDFPTAVKKLQDVLRQNPTPEVFTFLGAAHAQMGDSRRATAAFGEALKMDPGFIPARKALGLP
jgi:tetratricopeptide (TPR) repeat protein